MTKLENLTSYDLKKIIKESVAESLSDERLKKLLHEVVEDILFSKALDEGAESKTLDAEDLEDIVAYDRVQKEPGTPVSWKKIRK